MNIDNVKVRAIATAHMLEGATMVAFSGVGVSRTNKALVVGGLGACVVGGLLGTKVLVLGGLGVMVGGFMKGFREGMGMMSSLPTGGTVDTELPSKEEVEAVKAYGRNEMLNDLEEKLASRAKDAE